MSRLARLGHALKVPFVTVGRAYNETAQKNPMLTGVITTLVKTSAADMFAQKVIEGKKEMDWRRHGMFCSFGLVYLGCFQYYLYNHLFVAWCRPITRTFGHLGSAPVKTFIDQCLHHPFIYFPAFYTLKGLVEGRPFSVSMEKYQADLWDNCKALWTIWVPAQMINFTVVPLHLRIPFVAGVSFAWTVVISVMRGALDNVPPSAAQAAAVTAAHAGSVAVASSAASMTAMMIGSEDSEYTNDGPLGLQQLITKAGV